jgi:hypothetical protein
MEYDALVRARTCPDAAGRRARSGDWQRVGPGRYLPHRDELDDEALARVALDYAGPRALLTGRIAARALGLRWVPQVPGAQVLVPAGTRRRSTGLVSVRRTAKFCALEPWTWRGLPMAPPTRIVLDAALAATSLRDARGVVLGAVADRVTTPERLRAMLAHEPRNGTAAVRRAIHDAEVGAASPPEAECVDALRGCRLPFLVNPEVWVGQQLVGVADGYFVGLGAGWEMDSRERHDQQDTFDTTLARHDVFGGHGLVLSHLTPARLRRDPALAAGSVLAVARSRLLLPAHLREPKGLRLVPRGPLQS